jgi:hypothetical protein
MAEPCLHFWPIPNHIRHNGILFCDSGRTFRENASPRQADSRVLSPIADASATDSAKRRLLQRIKNLREEDKEALKRQLAELNIEPRGPLDVL